ncbi:MAG TPA: NDP-sugar synthase, partial [Candidatus Limnocylindria bacterium]|nr:NDP-sugar synthase [Candidatus Limnocylindria bacterium]
SVPAASLRPPVYIGRGCQIDPDAVVGPYAVLGDGCEVGPGAVVADSLLWDGVIVERGAQVDWTIAASRARIGANARVARGSVIGHDAAIPPGSEVEENARIAVRS